VTLTLICNDDQGCAKMRFSNNNVTYSDPEQYNATKSWTLASGDGTKKVYVRLADEAGNWSQAFSDEILLDTVPPSVAINGMTVQQTSVSICLVCGDGSGSGCDKIYYTTDGSTPTRNSNVYSSCTDAPKPLTLYYFGTDKAGNESEIGGITIQ